MIGFKSILVACDFSAPSLHALDRAVALTSRRTPDRRAYKPH